MAASDHMGEQFRVFHNYRPDTPDNDVTFNAQRGPMENPVATVRYEPAQVELNMGHDHEFPLQEANGQGRMMTEQPATLDMLAVNPHLQGQGLAQQVVNAALEHHRLMSGNSHGFPRLSEHLSADSAAMASHLTGQPHDESWVPEGSDDDPASRKAGRDRWAVDTVFTAPLTVSETPSPQSPLKEKLRAVIPVKKQKPPSTSENQQLRLF